MTKPVQPKSASDLTSNLRTGMEDGRMKQLTPNIDTLLQDSSASAVVGAQLTLILEHVSRYHEWLVAALHRCPCRTTDTQCSACTDAWKGIQKCFEEVQNMVALAKQWQARHPQPQKRKATS